jgi:hypothetical protein
MKYALIFCLLMASMNVFADETESPPAQPQLTDEQQEIADAEKASRLKELASDVKDAERIAKERQKTRDKDQIQKAKNELLFARKQLNAHKKRTDQEWLDAAQIRKQNEFFAATQAAENAKNRPLSIESLGLHLNRINFPQLVVIALNNTNKPIEAYTVSAECFTKFDEPVKDIAGSNIYAGISQTTIPAAQKDKGIWQLSLHRNTAYARVWITRVRFSDGTEWHQTREEALKRGQALFRVELD